MTDFYFKQILERRIKAITDTLASKAKEYATIDRLHNFHVAATMLNCSSKEALWGMAMKHLVSVSDIVNGTTKEVTRALAEEKIGDLINYLILLEAVLNEEHHSDWGPKCQE